MSCLEIRRAVLADPKRICESAAEHLAECDGCREYVAAVRQANSSIEQAIRLPIPDGLGARILLRRSMVESRKKLAGAFGLAASIVLMFGLWFGQPGPTASAKTAIESYAANLIEVYRTTPLDDERLDAVLNKAGIELVKNVGVISAAKPCIIKDGTAAHLTVAGKNGAVTVIILPEMDVEEAVEVKTASGLIGKLMPCPQGSIAIIAAPNEPIEDVIARFEGAVNWI
ncbi:MAG: DUF3379 family protein [Pseudomonadota bacterium]